MTATPALNFRTELDNIDLANVEEWRKEMALALLHKDMDKVADLYFHKMGRIVRSRFDNGIQLLMLATAFAANIVALAFNEGLSDGSDQFNGVYLRTTAFILLAVSNVDHFIKNGCNPYSIDNVMGTLVGAAGLWETVKMGIVGKNSIGLPEWFLNLLYLMFGAVPKQYVSFWTEMSLLTNVLVNCVMLGDYKIFILLSARVIQKRVVIRNLLAAFEYRVVRLSSKLFVAVLVMAVALETYTGAVWRRFLSSKIGLGSQAKFPTVWISYLKNRIIWKRNKNFK